jgi:molybdate transport system substrate-binding protein
MRWAVAAIVLVLAGCGGGGDDKPTLVVSAASSLTDALTTCSRQFDAATVRLSFAGSDELAAQIRQGVKPDVYAAANTKLPDQLADEGLLEHPVTFATNELVVAAPDDSAVQSFDDLAKPDVKGIVGKLTQGAADAGFVYRTDLVDGLRAVTVPRNLQPVVEYGAGVVKGANQPALAEQYLDGLRNGPCAKQLRSAGFGAP